MKTVMFSFFFFVHIYHIYGQIRFAFFEPITGGHEISAFQVSSNQDNILGVSYYNFDHLYWTTFSREGQLIEKKEFPTNNYGILTPIGVLSTEQNFFHFYEDEGHIIHIFSADKTGKSIGIKRVDVTQSKKKEKIIGRVSEDGTFYILVVGKKEKLLKLWKFSATTQTFEDKSFPIEEHWVKQFYYWANESKLSVFEPIMKKQLQMPSGVASFFKVYVNANKKVILTIDGPRAKNFGRTDIFTLDWENNKISTHILGSRVIQNGDYTKSLVYDEHFYQIYATKSRLNISISTFSENNRIKVFDYQLKDSIDILDSPLYSDKERPRFFSTKTKHKQVEQPSTRKVLSKLNGGAPFILPQYTQNNELLLTIGSYFDSTKGMVFNPSLMGAPAGALPISPIFFHSYDSYEKSNFFHTKINTSTFERIPSSFIENQINPALKFVKNELTDKHKYTIFPFQERFAVIHFLRKEREIKIDVFEN